MNYLSGDKTTSIYLSSYITDFYVVCALVAVLIVGVILWRRMHSRSWLFLSLASLVALSLPVVVGLTSDIRGVFLSFVSVTADKPDGAYIFLLPERIFLFGATAVMVVAALKRKRRQAEPGATDNPDGTK